MNKQPKPEGESHFLISGVVAHRDKRPYIHMDINGRLHQLSVSQARNIASNILLACSMAEADAMILRFFQKKEFPEGAAAAIMVDFREFRNELDIQDYENERIDPDSGAKR